MENCVIMTFTCVWLIFSRWNFFFGFFK